MHPWYQLGPFQISMTLPSLNIIKLILLKVHIHRMIFFDNYVAANLYFFLFCVFSSQTCNVIKILNLSLQFYLFLGKYFLDHVLDWSWQRHRSITDAGLSHWHTAGLTETALNLLHYQKAKHYCNLSAVQLRTDFDLLYNVHITPRSKL